LGFKGVKLLACLRCPHLNLAVHPHNLCHLHLSSIAFPSPATAPKQSAACISNSRVGYMPRATHMVTPVTGEEYT